MRKQLICQVLKKIYRKYVFFAIPGVLKKNRTLTGKLLTNFVSIGMHSCLFAQPYFSIYYVLILENKLNTSRNTFKI